MKKYFLPAFLLGMVLMISSCSSGSKEFIDSKKQISNIEKQVKQAKTCDELLMVAESFLNLAFSETEYEGKDAMTEEEKEKIQKMMDDLNTIADEKSTELGC